MLDTYTRERMELFSKEVQTIKGLLDDWRSHPEVEVEATFGFKGRVDIQTFLRVVTRLKTKGIQAVSQLDRLTIRLPDNLRFTLNGAEQVAQYCRDNTLRGKPFLAIIKDRTITSDKEASATIDLNDYDVRIKGRRELELSADDPQVNMALGSWARQRKYFRLIRRWTFAVPGLKYDLSMVRSTQTSRDGTAWQLNFGDQNLIALPPIYEIEVELDRETLPEGYTTDIAFQHLIRGIGDIMRGIQNNSILTRKVTKEAVLAAYKELTGSERFRGLAPVTLQRMHMTAEIGEASNIRNGYNVTDKADGLRVMGFTDKEGELFMIDMALNVYRTGLAKKECANALLDGEFVTKTKDGAAITELLFFDAYYIRNEDVSQKPFRGGRHTDMTEWMAAWDSNGGPVKKVKTSTIHVAAKRFFFGAAGDLSIFAQSESVLNQDNIRPYHTDGLIFTPNDEPIPNRIGRWSSQFKWKPSEENTVDFLVKIMKNPEKPTEDLITWDIQQDTGASVQYKTLQLFVGSAKADDPAYNNARETILNLLPLPGARVGEAGRRTKYRPVPFNPKDFQERLAGVCYRVTVVDPATGEKYVATERAEEPIRDMSIVEMRYDASKPNGWRWIPIRVRADKTERFMAGEVGGTLNNDEVAEDNWRSIHDPVTHDMITQGLEAPSEAELAEMTAFEKPEYRKYYERKADAEDQGKVRPLHQFHNRWIKDTILYASIAKNTPNPVLLDLACGRGNDLHRWRHIGASFVLGVDATTECCLNNDDGAYRRLLDTIVKRNTFKNPLAIPPMFFVVGDSSMRLVDGAAASIPGGTDMDRDMLRAILGRIAPMGPVPPAVTKYGEGALRTGASAITCMYALHYFFETPEKLNGLLQNIADNLKIGGYFVGTNFDGEAVFDLLRGTETGKSRVGQDGDSILWEIKKLYDVDEMPDGDGAIGLGIDVEFISIGMTHREYLVPWDLLMKKLRTIGCELVGPAELAAIGLQNSTSMYGPSHEMAMKSKDKHKRDYVMNKAAQEFSFLNRWYIFKRTSQGTGQIGKVPSDSELQANAAVFVPAGADADADAGELAELGALSAAVQDSATQAQMMASMAPTAGAAVATALTTQIREAERKGDTAALTALNQQAAQARTVLQSATGIAVGEGPLAAGPPGAVAKSFVKDYLGAAALAAPVPVEASTNSTKYPIDKVFVISETSSATDKYLRLSKYNEYAARHLAPNAPYPIRDRSGANDGTVYPSISHFLAAMKFKYATARPDTGPAVFGSDGSIAVKYIAEGIAEAKKTKTKVLTREGREKLIQDEGVEVASEEQRLLRGKGVKYDGAQWAAVKNTLLRDAILQRLEGDKRFCSIVSEALAANKYLLYYDTNPGSEMGGARVPRIGTIQGQNTYGRMIMDLARDAVGSEALRACLALPDPA